MKLNNKFLYYFSQTVALLLMRQLCFAQSTITFNRAPLKCDTYAELPLGSIKAKGWLLKQLENQRDGATGYAEELYPGKDELGSGSDWLGGPGNSWEKVPYYVKGLVALAYTLDDQKLKAKAQKWIDYTLNHQQPNGLFGPAKMKDWWPRMPFLYALQSYYEATNDKRIIPFMAKYFKYELMNLDQDPLRDWGKARAGDNMDVALWLYNKTGEKYLLDLVNKLRSQAYPWADIYNDNEFFYFGSDFFPRHMVNVAQALKFPEVYSQVDSSAHYADAMQNGINYIMRDNGLPQGLGSGTEMLAGKSSVEGVETCTVVEWMQSLETAFRIGHAAVIGDQLEKVAFNALPAQFSDDIKNHTYYTLPNEVEAVHGPHNYTQDYINGIVPSPYSGYPCCRYNMHMGWPYFVKNSWAASPDGGLAVNTYGPAEVTTLVNQRIPIKISEETDYPFDEHIIFKLSLQEAVKFPLRLRIPGWCKKPQIAVNGKMLKDVTPGQYLLISRKWHNKDQIMMIFPMEPVLQRQVNNAVSIERGPLVFALKIKQNEKHTKAFAVKGFYETEIFPASPWNFGLVADSAFSKNIIVVKRKMPLNPFVQDSTPVTLTIKAKRIPNWTLDYNNTAALEVPFSPVFSAEKSEEVTLVPFGAETLRLTIFPTIGSPDSSNVSYANNFGNNNASQFVTYGSGWFCRDNTIQTAVNSDNTSGGEDKAIATNTRFSDFEYRADVTVNSPGDAGLVFRVNDAAIGENAYRGYYVGIDAEKGIIKFGKATKGQWVVISSAKCRLELHKSYLISIKAVKDKFEVFVNDSNNPIITSIDNQYRSGSIGLRAFNALATVDNVFAKSL